jgi:hypothetical protein
MILEINIDFTKFNFSFKFDKFPFQNFVNIKFNVLNGFYLSLI